MNIKINKGKYFRNEVFEKVGLKRIAMFYMVCYYMLPQYFGIDLGFFDLTAQRIAMIFVLLYIFFDRNRISIFIDTMMKFKLLMPLCVYMFITLYTAVYRISIGSFMYPLIEGINIIILIYLMQNIYGIRKFIKLIQVFIIILCLHGLLESVLGFSLFSKLVTIQGIYGGAVVRSGTYRIMGPCNHSLAYGLVLITATPFICIDCKLDKINLLEHKVTLLLILSNIFLTGSRSSLAVFLLEVFLLFLFSNNLNKKRIFIFIVVCLAILSVIVIALNGTSFSNYILLQITSIIDEIFDTNFSVDYGASYTRLQDSSIYRTFLPQIFSSEALNPLIGKGTEYLFTWFHEGYYIKSIDNFYVATYIRYAYPGLVSYCLFVFASLITMLRTFIKRNSGIAGCMFIGSACYFINLWWMDTLQTIKYFYILLAFYYTYSFTFNDKEENKKRIVSTYIR